MKAKKLRPSRVVTGNHAWTVKYTQKALKAAIADAGETLSGYTNFGDLVITVDGNMPESRVQEILLHEVMHACLYSVGEVNDLIKGDDDEEGVIRPLAPALLHTLVTNEGLRRYLLA
jgi:hypothetical protein